MRLYRHSYKQSNQEEKKKIESFPVNISVVARMWDILPGTLCHWHRNHLSDYQCDKSIAKWPGKAIEDTGEVLEEEPVYVCKPGNIGERMSIEDKAIGHQDNTFMSNTDTSKMGKKKTPACTSPLSGRTQS
ncbi:MAG: hypothetical protein LBS79_06225 [Tannerella sp.]|nr:hypothetical protein [Tannerella sp.]